MANTLFRKSRSKQAMISCPGPRLASQEVTGWGTFPNEQSGFLTATGEASDSRMDREVQERPVSVWLRWGLHPLAIGQDRPSRRGPARAKVVQTVVCATFTRGGKPATGGWPMAWRTPGEGRRVRVNTADDEHEGDKQPECTVTYPG